MNQIVQIDCNSSDSEAKCGRHKMAASALLLYQKSNMAVIMLWIPQKYGQ